MAKFQLLHYIPVESPVDIDGLEIIPYDNGAFLYLYSNGHKIAQLSELRSVLHPTLLNMAEKIKVNDVTSAAKQKTVDEMTPADVLAYFRQSETLRQHYPDVRKLFLDKHWITENEAEAIRLDHDLEIVKRAGLNLFDEDGELLWGKQSEIGRVLGIKNAGTTERQRILDVIDILHTEFIEANSTTTKHVVYNMSIEPATEMVAR